MPAPSVPVIMYHSVGVRDPAWNFSYLTCPYQVFENQMRWLRMRGYSSITLLELFEYMKDNKKIPRKSVVLTFDDGYADNWVFACPILKKYRYQATIYVNPEFADPQHHPRENLADSWSGNVPVGELSGSGYLSWAEMKCMEEEGVADIQSHTMTHTWLPRSDRIIDFRHPDDPYTWMTWNQNTGRKPFLQKDDEALKVYGQPVFENHRAIGVKQFIPETGYDSFFIDFVEENGGREFFSSENWRDDLFRQLQAINREHPIRGRYETDEEYRTRLMYELETSKKILARKLDKEILFLCWPGGVKSAEAQEIAHNAGYLSSNVTKDMKRNKTHFENRYGEDPGRISRIGPGIGWDGVEGRGSRVTYKNGFFLMLGVERVRQGKGLGFLLKCILTGVSMMYAWNYKIRDFFTGKRKITH